MEFTKGYTPTILDCFITVLERETRGALAKAPPVIHLTPPLSLFLRPSVQKMNTRNAHETTKQSICPNPSYPRIFFNNVHLNKLKSAHNRRACNKQMMMLDADYDYSPWPWLLAPFFFAGLLLPIEDIVHDRDHQRQWRNKWSEATCSPSCLQSQVLRFIA